MAGKKIIAICQSGGEFETVNDGELLYKGGDAHAMEIEDNMKYKDFKEEVAEMFSCNTSTMLVKYFLPGNKKTLITISNEKDLKRMIKFHANSNTADLYVMNEEAVAPDVSNMSASRSSRTTVSEAGPLVEAPPSVATEEGVAGNETVGEGGADETVVDGGFMNIGMVDGGTVDGGTVDGVMVDGALIDGVVIDSGVGDHVVDGVIGDVTDGSHPTDMIDASYSIMDDAAHIGGHIDISGEMAPPSMQVVTGDGNHIRPSPQWQSNITGVGQRFNSVHEFREALRKFAIANQFAFKYKKNDSHRVTVKCKAEGCPWRIHASRLSTTQLICIKRMNSTHTCDGAAVTTGLQATRSWVASIIKEKLKADPSYKPKDIVTDIKQEYGIQLNYFQAWRGKEIAKEQLQGSYKEAYKQLPFFCEKIMETNPGSLATFTTKDDSSFHRLFVSFHASLHGFREGCRPLLFLDSIFLKSKYQGTLLAATAPDGDDGVFPVAFAVVDGDTVENWNWFLVQLKAALSTTVQSITFVADREKGLKESIAEVFADTDARHGYCIRYLSEQLMRDLKGQFSHEVKRLMVEDFYAAAYATRPEGFQRCIESIKNISIEAYNWIVRSEPVQWANAFFQGTRYNHLMSNFGEMFYSWAAEAHDLPITQMVNSIRGKIMELIYTRRAESQQWMTRLTPSMEERLEKESLKTRSLQVLLSTTNKFEVRGESIEVVDVQNLDCSCKGWQLTGLPCCHALAVIGCLNQSPYDFCSKYLTADYYRRTYSESINPVPNIERSISKKSAPGSSGALAVCVTPPPTRRPPGRPTTKQLGLQESGKRQLQCSRCKSTGHNKSTCKEFMIEF